jgi:hypothetical protein
MPQCSEKKLSDQVLVYCDLRLTALFEAYPFFASLRENEFLFRKR